jgi:hypothetical protein
MKGTSAPIAGDHARATYNHHIIAPDITMPATTAPAVIPKQPSARKLAKEKLYDSISALYSPNAKV